MPRVCVAAKGLTYLLSSLDATLTKNPGEGGVITLLAGNVLGLGALAPTSRDS